MWLKFFYFNPLSIASDTDAMVMYIHFLKYFSYITQMTQTTNFVVMGTFCGKESASQPFRLCFSPICHEMLGLAMEDLGLLEGHLIQSCGVPGIPELQTKSFGQEVLIGIGLASPFFVTY
jgi:hypothetical protein